jgi:transcriptional regulator with XRE-family HTH domain
MQPAAQTLARSLKRRRLERALSLSELARRSGVSKATLSALERGIGNPSVDTVWALAQALSIPFGDLFEDAEEEGFRGRRLLTRHRRGALELYVLDIERGTRREAAAHSPGVIEHVIVIDGTAEVGPIDEPTQLQAGDCITFAADLPHLYRAVDGATRLLSLTDYP